MVNPTDFGVFAPKKSDSTEMFRLRKSSTIGASLLCMLTIRGEADWMGALSVYSFAISVAIGCMCVDKYIHICNMCVYIYIYIYIYAVQCNAMQRNAT